MKPTSVWITLCVMCLAASDGQAETIRFATFNVSLFGRNADELRIRLETKDDPQCKAVAEIIQRCQPDVLLLNEFDYDPNGKLIDLFQINYLSKPQNFSQSETGPAEAIQFPFHFYAPSNTGIPSGQDLDRNGKIGANVEDAAYGGDCWGYGRYPGQYGMVILSKFPIQKSEVRTFRNFRWKDMPGALLPDDPNTENEGDWYSSKALEQFPLSSKSHWDVPVRIKGSVVHILASHPTPPVYDGPEDRNGRRNQDEIRFWVDYIAGGQRSAYIYDDDGLPGGLASDAKFVIMGDLNGDPEDGDGREGIRLLLDSSRIAQYDPPKSEGGREQSTLQGGANLEHKGDARLDTLDAADNPGPGNLRLDYVLPARGMRCVASQVFWPNNNDSLFTLIGTHPFVSSDHRLVWVAVELDAEPERSEKP